MVHRASQGPTAGESAYGAQDKPDTFLDRVAWERDQFVAKCE
jgi:hypothetical protein